MDESIERVSSPARLPLRNRDAHKGDFGRVLVVGGSRGMIGAAALAANAALRGGAGLVTFAAPETVQLTIAAICPCATSIPLACDGDGELAPKAVGQTMTAAGECDVLAVGPGMGIGGPQTDIVRAALEQEKPLVLDADALNNLARIDDWPTIRRCPLILTPHPGEFARLTGLAVRDIQVGRQAVASTRKWLEAAKTDAPLVCALKGAGTIVTDGGRAFVNATGNPGLATGGSGDVLTGLTAALLAQGMEPFDAASLAVHLHGLTGDLAAEKLGEASLIATDLLDFLPHAMKQAGC